MKNLCSKTLDVVGINFCSVDIIKLETGELKILECNSGKLYKIYEEAISKMFD